VLSTLNWRFSLASHRPADVVKKDRLKIGIPTFDIANEGLQGTPPVKPQPAAALVGAGPNDLEAATGRILLDDMRLVLVLALLMIGRHPHVFGSSARQIVRPRSELVGLPKQQVVRVVRAWRVEQEGGRAPAGFLSS
jgi:hypothetical protein